MSSIPDQSSPWPGAERHTPQPGLTHTSAIELHARIVQDWQRHIQDCGLCACRLPVCDDGLQLYDLECKAWIAARKALLVTTGDRS
jgi:hypothetical protein